jgi:phage terminase small subunit
MARKAIPRETKERNINGLTAREQTFCDAYLKSGSTTEAMMACGFSKSTAEKKRNEIYNRPPVQSYLQRMAKLSEGQGIADDKEIQEYFTSVMRGEKDTQELLNQFKGGGVQETVIETRKPNGKERLDAAVNLAKIRGMYNRDINATVIPIIIKDDI